MRSKRKKLKNFTGQDGLTRAISSKCTHIVEPIKKGGVYTFPMNNLLPKPLQMELPGQVPIIDI